MGGFSPVSEKSNPLTGKASWGLAVNLLRTVTLSAVLLAYSGVNNSTYGGDMADAIVDPKREAKRQEEIKGALDSVAWAPADNILEMRELCAAGAMNGVKAELDKKGVGFPEVAAMCRKVIDGAAERNLSSMLYINQALGDLYNRRIVSEESINKVSNDEVIRSLGNIVASASKGETTHPTLSGKVVPLRPEQAYDAGHWFGQLQPQTVPDMPSAELNKVADQCFSKTPAKTITIQGLDYPATQACLIAGGNFGKQVMLSKEKAELPTRPETDVVDGKVKTGAVTRSIGN